MTIILSISTWLVRPRGWLVILVLSLGAAPAYSAAPAAKSRGGKVMTQAQFVQAVVQLHYLPRLRKLAETAPRLHQALSNFCATRDPGGLPGVQQAWIDTMLSWESTNAVAYGPLVARRSVYRIDFWAERTYMLQHLTREPPRDLAALETVGGPAKGLPMLEWLLWSPDYAPNLALNLGGKCSYAVLVSEAIVKETQTLDADFAALNDAGMDEAQGRTAFNDLLNQTLGALIQLGYKKMERPLIVPRQYLPRAPSGQTRQAWDTQWASIRALLVGAPGQAAPTLAGFMHDHKLGVTAKKLQTACDRVSTALAAASPESKDDVLKVVEELKALQELLRADIADALDVTIDFLEVDGD